MALVSTGTFVILAFFLTTEKGRYLRVTSSIGDKRRGPYLLLLLIIYGVAGTIDMYISGGNCIEIGVEGSTQHSNTLIEILVLAYNVVF